MSVVLYLLYCYFRNMLKNVDLFFVILLYSTFLKSNFIFFPDLHIYNYFFLIPTPNIKSLAGYELREWHQNKFVTVIKYPRITATFALAEARTYDDILTALPTIEKFSQQWRL